MEYEGSLATILQSTTALFALAAAYSWFRVGRIKTPADINFIVFGDGGLSGPLAEVAKGVAQQGIWNYRGAICAGVAAILQTLSIAVEQLL